MLNRLKRSWKAKREEYGGDTAFIGETEERTHILDGVRVRITFPDFPEYSGKIGTIYLVLINREKRLVQIWVNVKDEIEGEYAWCLRPKNIEIIDETIDQKQMKFISEHIN